MIIGIGLPRTGTRSLSLALELLGFTGSHHCELIGTTREPGVGDSYRIDNSFYHDISAYNPKNLYICTTRPAEEWRNSIFQFKEYDGPDIESYLTQCKSTFTKTNTRLLAFDIRTGWKPLCEFLNLPIPNEDFPTVK